LSFVLPGAGQGYNGQWGKAAVFLGVTLVAFTMVTRGDGLFACEAPDYSNDKCSTATVGALIGAASWIGSQIDAPISAAAINRRGRTATPRASVTLLTLRF
jgi:hypothetical protein